MAFNITIVSFGKKPDLSDRAFRHYQRFDPALAGKKTRGTAYQYDIPTAVPTARVVNIQFRDDQVESPNVVLVFENPPLPPAGSKPGTLHDDVCDIIREMTQLLKLRGSVQVGGVLEDGGVMAVLFLETQAALRDYLAEESRQAIRKRNR